MAVHPIEHVLSGLNFDRVRYSKTRFNITPFFQPLYVPFGHINLTLSVANGTAWDWSELDTTDRILSWLAEEGIIEALRVLTTPAAIARWVELHDESESKHFCFPQAHGFSRAMQGQFAEARRSLRVLIDHPMLKSREYDWQVEQIRVAQKLLDSMSSDPHAAKVLLTDWEQSVRESLRLMPAAENRPS